MINEGIFGLEEVMTPEIQGDKVAVSRSLSRFNGDAAVPPGQSVQFQFYVAQFPITIDIYHYASSISTTERAGPRGRGRTPTTRAFATDLGEAVTDTPRTGRARGGNTRTGAGRGTTGSGATGRGAAGRGAAARGLAGRGARDGSVDGGGGPTLGTIARMRGIDNSIFGSIFDPDVLPPFDPDDFPDPVIPFEVTLTPPNGLAVISYTNPKRSQIHQIPVSETARIDPEFLDKGRGLWTISVKNINPDARRIQVKVNAVHALTPLQHQSLPLSLLNNLMVTVFRKTVPTIAFSDGNLVVQTPTHFLGLAGIDTEYSLSNIVTSLIDSMPTFSPFTAVIESRPALIERINARRTALAEEYGAQIHALALRNINNVNGAKIAALTGRMNRALAACDKSITRLNNLPEWRAQFCIVIEGMFSDAPISLDYVGTVANIDNKFPQIALVFDEKLQVSEVVTNISVDLSPALTKVVLGTVALAALSAVVLSGIFAPLGIALAIFGGVTLYNSIDSLNVEEKIRLAILSKGPAISHYVKSAFERISAMGASALKCELIPHGAPDHQDALRISYYDPATAVPPRPRRPFDDIRAESFELVAVAAGESSPRIATGITSVRQPGGRRASERRVGLAREAPGPIPDDFIVANPETLGLVDQHAAIVVLMMENRSFDHFFHDLAATFPGRGYSAVPADFTNAPPPGFGEPFQVTKNSDVGIGNSLIFSKSGHYRSSDPNHNFEHTAFQIGDGSRENLSTGDMNGFARDFALQSDSPQIVMSYFGMESLPTYRALAEQYPVCDQWYAALPVGTYPNRLASLQGNVPFLHNLHPDDPATGYLEDYSIFDLLNSQGISWKFFESDLGTIRLYDRYRLDVTNVRPIAELDDTLRFARDTGQLPRVMFIEPEFLFGNDDHPPMDIQGGQEFVKQVVGKFIDFGLLDRVLLLVTYDEHGGFFDHVPPPGSDRGPAEWLDKVASLFPQEPEAAPKSMGVRVPSLALSKFMSNTAKHQVLDHTSILKTILLHNRLQISPAQFGRFGERVKQGAHFGQLMDLPSPRTIDYAALAQAMGYHSETSWFSYTQPTIVEGRVAQLGPTHPARVLRGIAQPRAKRYVAEL